MKYFAIVNSHGLFFSGYRLKAAWKMSIIWTALSPRLYRDSVDAQAALNKNVMGETLSDYDCRIVEVTIAI